MDAVKLLQERREAIVADAAGKVHRAHLEHYEAEGSQLLPRLETLFDRLLESLSDRDLSPIVSHAQELAQERFATGYDISEVQVAFNVLEEAVWRCVLAELEPDRYAESLGLVTTALGAGKDALGRTYVSLATKAHAPSLDLKRLFEGTDGV